MIDWTQVIVAFIGIGGLTAIVTLVERKSAAMLDNAKKLADSYKELRPADGKVLHNGKDYTTAVAMPINADHSMWTEVDELSPEDMEGINDTEALNIITGV